MRLPKLRLYAAGLVALLLGVPFTPQTRADDVIDIVDASLDLASAIASSAGNS